MLFISGGSDHILPPVVQQHNYKKNAKHSTAIAAHKVFPGRDHFTCGEPGWEAVADFAPRLGPRPGRGRAWLTSADDQRPAVPRGRHRKDVPAVLCIG